MCVSELLYYNYVVLIKYFGLSFCLSESVWFSACLANKRIHMTNNRAYKFKKKSTTLSMSTFSECLSEKSNHLTNLART